MKCGKIAKNLQFCSVLAVFNFGNEKQITLHLIDLQAITLPSKHWKPFLSYICFSWCLLFSLSLYYHRLPLSLYFCWKKKFTCGNCGQVLAVCRQIIKLEIWISRICWTTWRTLIFINFHCLWRKIVQVIGQCCSRAG